MTDKGNCTKCGEKLGHDDDSSTLCRWCIEGWETDREPVPLTDKGKAREMELHEFLRKQDRVDQAYIDGAVDAWNEIYCRLESQRKELEELRSSLADYTQEEVALGLPSLLRRMRVDKLEEERLVKEYRELCGELVNAGEAALFVLKAKISDYEGCLPTRFQEAEMRASELLEKANAKAKERLK